MARSIFIFGWLFLFLVATTPEAEAQQGNVRCPGCRRQFIPTGMGCPYCGYGKQSSSNSGGGGGMSGSASRGLAKLIMAIVAGAVMLIGKAIHGSSIRRPEPEGPIGPPSFNSPSASGTSASDDEAANDFFKNLGQQENK